MTDVGKRVANSLNYGERRDAAGTSDRHESAGDTINGDRIRLYLKAVMHVCDVTHEDLAAIDLPDWVGIEGLDQIGAVVHRQKIVLRSNLYVAGRQDHVLGQKGVTDVRGGQTARLERLLVKIGHDDAGLAP